MFERTGSPPAPRALLSQHTQGRERQHRVPGRHRAQQYLSSRWASSHCLITTAQLLKLEKDFK